jgi:hypothetical protein
MAYTLISTQTVGAGGTTSIDFNSIPQTYTDLYLVLSITAPGINSVLLKINGTTTNFTSRGVEGNGSAASSWVRANDIGGYNNTTANSFSSIAIYFSNYNSTTKNKAYSIETVAPANATLEYDDIIAGLWSSTAAITSLSIYNSGAQLWSQYSSASLYGVTSDSTYGIKATGGTIVQTAGYTYHVFTANGTFTPTTSVTADVLVIAGGGSGGGPYGGGGGAGGVVALTSQTLSGARSVIVGAGGPALASGVNTSGNQGNNSSVTGLTAAIGGGAGGGPSLGGGNGGSGGGAGYNTTASGGTAVSGQGYAGGSGITSPIPNSYDGAGGGGAGGTGQNTPAIAQFTFGTAGAGGPGTGLYSTWATTTGTGVSGYYAGGGGGGGAGGAASAAAAASGGGGAGSNLGGAAGDGTVNTGSGGGGSGGPASGAGGSGIVIIRYL